MIYVTRHGQTNWNALKKVMGRCDEPLNENGLSQAEETRKKLLDYDIDLIICSPLTRAKQTAEIINRDRNIPIIYDDRIIERDFGEFEGKTINDFDFLGYWDYYKNEKYNSAENIQEFFKRVYSFLDEITKKYKDKNVLLVTHGGVSISIDCFFNNTIPSDSLINTGPALGHCEVKEYDIKNE